MTDSGFYENSTDQGPKLRQPVMARIDTLAQSTNWLHGGNLEEASRVQMAVGAVIHVIIQCLNVDPNERPPANELSTALKRICYHLRPW